jgi:hypothetical protein
MSGFDNSSQVEKYFSPAMENNIFKTISVIFATLATPVCIVLLYGLIWFEKFGTDCRSTLANKFLSSTCWSLIYTLIVCSLDIIRYVFGPLPKMVCFFAVVARNAVQTQVVLFYNAILITRYVYIFLIKNPGGVDDGFWCRFISISIVGFSTFINLVIYTLPVKQPMFYFVCADIDPQSILSQTSKPLIVHEMLSLLLLIIIRIRIVIHKKKTQPAEPTNIFHKNYVLSMIEKQNIADFTSNLIALLSLTCLALIIFKVNSMTITEINLFPNFLLLYFFQMFSPQLVCFTMFMANYRRCKNMRETFKRELKEQFNLEMIQCID